MRAEHRSNVKRVQGQAAGNTPPSHARFAVQRAGSSVITSKFAALILEGLEERA